ncbi:MAG: alanine--tRNA ligase [Alphaproteobacteria bacterium]|nr:alanine--tRNA ligase [Alphaproteobacteria bacterium]
MKTNDIRKTFLDYFADNHHAKLPSSALVPHNDPTLLFTNAGMVQFKNYFTGLETPTTPRATSSQKCVRAGGKHNDLDNVGYTKRHLTFFEMLGNFSFGDYFKEQAISHAWSLLTEHFKLPVEKLSVTVYHTDDEAFDLWKKITNLPDEKILRIPTSDNFWQMGDTGPCGPCSEIFYDHGPSINGEWKLDADGNDLFDERYVEIWNLVFMQYEQHEDGSRTDLPKPCIDTGMGLERMATVMQGKTDVYDTDLFRHLIEASKEHSGVDEAGEAKTSHRIIADHLRSSAFLMADGVMPSNEGRGYVLRRIMRRAMRHAHKIGCTEPLMYRLVPALMAQMGEAYPELLRAQALITENLKSEEERFKQTLERGLKLLEEERATMAANGKLSGDMAFKLYDTYGFPLDLTETILRDSGQSVDLAGFEAAMAKQKDMARAAWVGSGAQAINVQWFDIKEKAGAVEFLGYAQDEGEAIVKALVVDGEVVTEAQAGSEAVMITNQTPFYGESGGQMGDTGTVAHDGKAIAEVMNTAKPLDDFIVHHIKLKAPLKVNDTVHLTIDVKRRSRLRANHSATHILHKVLRDKIGDHVTQKGSLVAPDRLRFDISQPKPLSREDLAAVEAEVNHIIWLNEEVCTEVTTPDIAIEKGALALFGEKYGDEVRVVRMGALDAPSIEFCGGTHVRRTGDIGLFKIISEGAVAAGIRRIEAVTGPEAYAMIAQQENLLREVANVLKTPMLELPEKVETLLAERKKREKQLADVKRAQALEGAGGDDVQAESIGTITYVAKSFDDLPPKELRSIADSFRKKTGANIIVVGTGFDGKASLVVSVSSDVQARFNAADLVNTGAAKVGGKGGGKPDMAQAGGPDGSRLEEALKAIRDSISSQMVS